MHTPAHVILILHAIRPSVQDNCAPAAPSVNKRAFCTLPRMLVHILPTLSIFNLFLSFAHVATLRTDSFALIAISILIFPSVPSPVSASSCVGCTSRALRTLQTSATGPSHTTEQSSDNRTLVATVRTLLFHRISRSLRFACALCAFVTLRALFVHYCVSFRARDGHFRCSHRYAIGTTASMQRLYARLPASSP